MLAEIVWTLSSYYQFPKNKVIQALRSIINLRGLKVIDACDHKTSLEIYEKYQVKYINAAIASDKDIASNQATVVTYDADFAKLDMLSKTP